MKKILILFLILGLLQSGSFAQELDGKKIVQIKKEITKVQKEIKRLEEKIEKVKSRSDKNKIEGLVNGHQARLKKLKAELEEISKTEVEPEVQEIPSPEAENIPEFYREEEREEAKAKFKFEIGGAMGLFAGTTAMSGEIRFSLPYILGPATSSFRISGGLAQSEDMSRRYVPLQMDAILNFPPGMFSGVENYLGGGLNYVVLTNGRTSGSIGAEVFYGVESEGFGGRIFGEMGYGILRTGFTPSHRGITVLFGYRR